MRELYAVDVLASGHAGERDRIEQLVRQWATNPFEELDADALAIDGVVATGNGTITTATGPDGWVLRWAQTNDDDASLVWHTEVAVGDVNSDLRVTIRIGIGQAAHIQAPIRAMNYEFRSPAIVRTLLKELAVFDAGDRVEPRHTLIGASGIPDLVGFLTNPKRRLPVIVLTGLPETGAPIAEPNEMARQLAGLAHVRVLTSGLAARELGEAVGRDRSVWLGGARIYWPGFTAASNPFEHKLWTPARIRGSRLPLTDELRRWIGTIAATRTPDHPAALTSPQAAGPIDELPEWAQEYVDGLEAANKQLSVDLKAAQGDVADRDEAIAELEGQVALLQASFAEVFAAAPRVELGDTEGDEVVELPVTSVREAVDRAIAEAGDRIVFLDRAKKSGYEFKEYQDPGKFYRALRDLTEASAMYAGGSLGMSLTEWFRVRGYEYSSSNDAARSRKHERHYKVQYQDRKVIMEPHLKVDEATSPDQCLRIYWYIDEVDRTFVVGHMGRHLPPF